MSNGYPEWTAFRPGLALTGWMMSAPRARYFPGTADVLPDLEDYVFRNGWVATGDLPCRRALRAWIADRVPSRPQGPFVTPYAADGGAQVDFSTFCHRPTLVRHDLQTDLRFDTAGLAEFHLTTCGGVHIWLDDALVARFQPYTRNTPADTILRFEVQGGAHRLTVTLEDLHERDTTCAFALIFRDGPCGAVRQNGHTPPLHDAYPDRLFCEDTPARLVASEAVEVQGLMPFARGGIAVDPDRRICKTLRPGAPFFGVETTSAGCLDLTVARQRATRRLGLTNLPSGTPLPAKVTEAKSQAADLIARHGGFDPARACLLAWRRERPDVVSRILDVSLDTIEERWDCSDFTILPLLRLWRDGRDTLTPHQQDRLRRAVLGWRYWMTEPGDDVMWFWSENHVLCFHAAQAVAGRLFPDATFANSGRSGTEMTKDAVARLHRWFDAIDRDGLCEWNSAAYYPIDLLGLLTLHDMLPDLRDRAAALMDKIFVMAALHTSGDTPAGTQGRCYEKELLAGPCTELGSVMAIALGARYRPEYDRAAALFCLSDYTPPDWIGTLARPSGKLEARYTQGHAHAGKLMLWKSPEGQLSTVTELPAGTQGHQAQVLDVQMSGHPMARLWLNHPGELKPWGERRPSLLAGSHVMPQVAQDGPLALAVWDIDRPWAEVPFTQVFAMRDAFDPPRRLGEWMIFACGEGRCAVWCSAPLRDVSGLYAGALWRAHAPRTGWVVTLAQPGEDDDTFAKRLIATRPGFDADDLRLDCIGADGSRLALPFDGPLHKDGVARPFDALTPAPRITLNGRPIR